MKRTGRFFLVLIALVLVVLVVPVVMIGFLFGFPFAMAVLQPPAPVLEVTSPDQQYVAYVEEQPSLDPPNQALFIEQNDRIHYRHIANLPEDVDSIQQIHWSPESDLVVFQTHMSLIAVRIPGFEQVHIPFGGVYIRSQAERRSTFSTKMPEHPVEQVVFPTTGAFSYQISGASQPVTVDLNAIRP
jgi:hypothetical protein